MTADKSSDSHCQIFRWRNLRSSRRSTGRLTFITASTAIGTARGPLEWLTEPLQIYSISSPGTGTEDSTTTRKPKELQTSTPYSNSTHAVQHHLPITFKLILPLRIPISLLTEASTKTSAG